MSNNLVLSAAVGYNFQQIELFIKSLRKYFSGQVCFIIGHNDSDLEAGLKKYSCNIIKTKINKRKIQFERYEIFLNFLQNRDFDQILLCDSRDIYFQENPFKYKFNAHINFFLEDCQIGKCKFNSNWIIKTYGQSEFEKISKKTILCSGTVLGKQNKISEYLNLMKNNINNFSYKKRLKYFLTFRIDPEGRGCDQGHANYIVHNKIIKDVELYSNSKGPFATVFYLNKINFDKNSHLINELGNPYILVHQYDKRWDEFSKHVISIKANL